MTSGFDYNPRVGNNYPHVHNPTELDDFNRATILYSYENTVEQSYTGDLRVYIKKFGDYLASKAAYWDPVSGNVVPFNVVYSAPNEVFSDNKGAVGNSTQNPIDSRIVLPIISYHLAALNYDGTRAQAPRNRMSFWNNPDEAPGRNSLLNVAAAPKPMKFQFQVDVWVANREQLMQLTQAVHMDFMPYGYLYDIYDFDVNKPESRNMRTEYRPYAKMTLNATNDSSNFVPGLDRRVVRGTWDISVDGWLSSTPKQLPYAGNYTQDAEVLGTYGQLY